MKVCLSEMGTVWLPYTLRKMDHAFLMGRKAKWADDRQARPAAVGDLPRALRRRAVSPRRTCRRVVTEVGIEPIVFGSDFPHGEGLAFPGAVRRAPSSHRSASTSDAGSCATPWKASFPRA